MGQFKCAFNGTLIGDQYGCLKSEHVTLRSGPDVVCTAEEAGHRCAGLFNRMKAAALPAFGVEDDLLSMPHSVIVKVQFGGLLGLQRLLSGLPADSPKVDNIYALVDQALHEYGDLDAIPCQSLVEDITSYKLRRRSR